uniref:hypothetical protein n=1 Tax=Amycolatopsis sp. CA-096443 TaxID=3239919 RepID=UPI003F495D60
MGSGVALLRSSPRSKVRTTAVAVVSAAVASRTGLPLLDLVPAHAVVADVGLAGVAALAALPWLRGAARRLVRAAAGAGRGIGTVSRRAVAAEPVRPIATTGVRRDGGAAAAGREAFPAAPCGYGPEVGFDDGPAGIRR